MNKTKDIALTALFIALTAVFTMIVRIPIPRATGYINLGDAVVLIAAGMCGKKGGALCGGLGSAAADVLSGYPQWAVFTLVIKAVEGFLAGLGGKKTNPLFAVLSLIFMVAGYFVAGVILEGFVSSVASLGFNALQALVCGIIYFIAKNILKRGRIWTKE